ncbi:hypothetical protein EV424DRAFT_1542980 [Suillus variegatus]|nr:hypothetical protein EV424DRAFT_1542980 [Suillus variegatus]
MSGDHLLLQELSNFDLLPPLSMVDPKHITVSALIVSTPAKDLLVNHVYHYEQHFNEKNIPIAQSKKPYFAEILPYLMKGRYFNGPKSVGMKFSDRFEEIASNKAQRPEVTIPMVALTSTSKANGSPSKFNFTGNLFSEVYFFHVELLEKMKGAAPGKFHKMMADIFDAIQ